MRSPILLSVAVFVAALVPLFTAHARSLSRGEKILAATLGGFDPPCTPIANNCLAYKTTCPDSTYSTCTRVGTTSNCQQCTMSVSSYAYCKTSQLQTQSCCTVVDPSQSPWCGVYFTGNWNDTFIRCDLCNTKTSNNCGVQYGVTIGVNCN